MMPDYSDYKRHVLRLGFSENDFLFDLLAPAFKPRELQRIAGPVLKRILNQYHPIHVVNGHLNMCREMDLDLVNKLRYLDLKLTLPEDMLVKVDRTSMVNSLEVRPVYLHPRMIDFALGLPTTMLVNHSIGKYLPKKALETWLPPDILYRPKMGFGLPLNTWFFGDLHEVLNHGLDNLPKDWFDKTEINKLLANHLKGKRDFILQIHCLVFLGCWLASKGIKG
jgi:asparagine synthase (glutamine-hydrolysing)